MGKIIELKSVNSTNDYLKSLALRGAEPGTVVLAEGQTAGRGRGEHGFISPPGMGVYLSMLMCPSAPAGELPQLTAWAGVAVCRALSGLGVDAGIKWVNDLVLGRRKLGGILAELTPAPCGNAVIVGVGVNALQESFPEELSAIATSIYLETGKRIPCRQAADAIIRELDALREDFPRKKAEYLEFYRRLCVTLGREVRFASGTQTRTGLAEAVDAEFGLVVRYPGGGGETLRFGEVSVRGTDGHR